MFLGLGSRSSVEEILAKLRLRCERYGEVSLGERKLDLSEKPKSFALFELFIGQGVSSIHRADLTERLYGSIACKSERLGQSMRHNTVKLVSRCRKMAEREFGSSFDGLKIRWLPYDHSKETYYFYEAALIPPDSEVRFE